MDVIKMLSGGILAAISGNAIWVLGVINLVWLLFKDYALFSWWWVIGSAIVFVVSLIFTVFQMAINRSVNR